MVDDGHVGKNEEDVGSVKSWESQWNIICSYSNPAGWYFTQLWVKWNIKLDLEASPSTLSFMCFFAGKPAHYGWALHPYPQDKY